VTQSTASSEKEAQRLLEGWLGGDSLIERRAGRDAGVDLTARMKGVTFAVEVKATAGLGSLRGAVRQILAYAPKVARGAIPVVVVPYMTDMGKRLCKDAAVSWFDLSGNADIRGPGVRVYVEGKPNRFKRRGRPATAFAPRSSRIVRALLLAKGPLAQHDLAKLSGLDEGFSSRIIGKLVDDELVERQAGKLLRVRDTNVLLDAWKDEYDFEKHHVLKGHVTTRSGDDALKLIGNVLQEKKIEHAATGLGAAWLLTKFAGFRLSTFFLSREPDERLREVLGFREEERGANIWLVVPNDDAVFTGARAIDGVRCVHPLQAYLDLAAQPERASEAASELRTRLLSGRS
jgi:hypothetical protein